MIPQAAMVRVGLLSEPRRPELALSRVARCGRYLKHLGIQDVVAKSTGSQNPHNMVKATINALENLMSPRSVAAKRGKKVSDIVGRRDGAQARE